MDLSGLEQEAVGIPTRGGADSSLERNNVYALQPRVYVEGSQESGQEGLHTVSSIFANLSPCGPLLSSTVHSAWKPLTL